MCRAKIKECCFCEHSLKNPSGEIMCAVNKVPVQSGDACAKFKESTIKALESSNEFYLIVIGDEGFNEFKNFSLNNPEKILSLMRLISILAEQRWKILDKKFKWRDLGVGG